jgi:hypothetical protein
MDILELKRVEPRNDAQQVDCPGSHFIPRDIPDTHRK